MHLQLLKQKKWVLSLIIPLLLISCSEIRLIGAYDQTVDESIQKISKDVSTLLVEIGKNIETGNTPGNKYENFKNRYIDIEGDVATLRIRCSALDKYEKITEQVDSLQASISLLEKAHKEGFQAVGEINIYKRTFEVEFKSMITLQNGLKREKVNKE